MKKIILLCLFVLFLCGCSDKPNAPESASVATDSLQTIPSASSEVISPEEPENSTTVKTEPTTEPSPDFPLESGSYLRSFTDEETEFYLDYYLFVPDGATEQMPLVVFLHGDGEVGKPEVLEDYGLIKSAREIYGNAFPFIAISPCTRIKSWISGRIPGTVIALIDRICADLSINTDRIIITGHSRGAVGVWYLVSTYGDYFAAAVPISCGSETALDMDSFRNVPIRAYAGDIGKYENMYRDAMMQIVEKINKNGGNAQLIVLENRDHGQMATNVFTEDTFNWMLNQ